MPTLPLRIGVLLLLAAALLAPRAALAQAGSSFYNPKDDQYRLLGLKRAREAFEAARAEHDRQRALYEKRLISETEWDRVQRTYSAAEVDYQQALLAVLFENQYVSVDGAVKYQASDGRKRVRLTLRNTSNGGAEFMKLAGLDDEIVRLYRPDVVHNVYVSLLNEEGAIMSQPYEAKLEALQYDQPVTIDFGLLQDIDAVTVNLVYGNGAQSTRKIYLQKDASFDRVVLQSQQFAQEVELGSTATYDLSLELFSGETNTYGLEVVNLPPQIARTFMDPGTQARLSQFKFTEGTNTRRAVLQVALPQRASEALPVDVPIAFYVLVIPAEKAAALGSLQERIWSQPEIEALGVGFVRLELVPRGVGQILVRAPQLFRQIEPGETVEVTLDVVNEGTRRLDNVTIEAEPPLNWTKEISPAVIPTLEVGEERRVTLRFVPADDVSVGRYEVRVRTSSYSNNQPIAGEDKTMTVEVKARADWLGTAFVLSFIVTLVCGMVVFGIRLSRR